MPAAMKTVNLNIFSLNILFHSYYTIKVNVPYSNVKKEFEVVTPTYIGEIWSKQ